MIVRGFRRSKPEEQEPDVEVQGYDAYDLRLGDTMRGERATMGKSLLDVQRELKIKAAYIAAIENADPTAFDTPGFIAGYVRSYARYLNMDPDWAFETFCLESGFQTSHGMSAKASSRKSKNNPDTNAYIARDIFNASTTPFIPAGERVLSNIEPRAIGSIAVLLVLIGGLGFGGYSVLQEVQRVQFAPIEQPPTILAEVDPLAGSSRVASLAQDSIADLDVPSPEALDRLYRPQALELPRMTARDGPIASLERSPEAALGRGYDQQLADVDGETLVPTDVIDALVHQLAEGPDNGVQVTETPAPAVVVVAAREAWVRVRSADGSTIYEATMQPGDTFVVPQTELPPTLRVGESGAIYFAVNGVHYGPAGPRGSITANLALSVDDLTTTYQVADIERDNDLAEIVRFAEVQGLTVPLE